jgi:tRNA(Ile2) C34 agmatinyltransferase TiaS
MDSKIFVYIGIMVIFLISWIKAYTDAALEDEKSRRLREALASRRPACPACGGPTVDRGGGVWCDRCHRKVESCGDGGRQ